MKQISNSTLVFLLIAAIAISIGSTVVSIYRINQLIPRITGMGATGMVNVTITQQASVNVIDTQINFGSCTPTAGTGCNVSSDHVGDDDFGCGGGCTGGSAPDNITLQNDGNVNLNLTVKTNVLASTMIGGTNPNFWYRSANATTRPGCQNQTSGLYDNNVSIQLNWTNFTTAANEYTVCGNLTFEDSTDQVLLFAKLTLPADAPISAISRNATLTFTANAVP